MNQLQGASTFGKFYRAAYDAALSESLRSRFEKLSQAGNKRGMVEMIIDLPCVAQYKMVESFRNKNDALAMELYEKSLKFEPLQTSNNHEKDVEMCEVLDKTLFAATTRSRLFLEILLKRANYWYRIGAFAKCLRDCETVLALPTNFYDSCPEIASYFLECKNHSVALKNECLEKLYFSRCFSRNQPNGRRLQTGKKDSSSFGNRKKDSSTRLSSEDVETEILGNREKEIPVIVGNPHAYLKSCSDAVALEFNEKRGRHLVATRNISAGSVLIVDRPFSTSTDEEALDRNCLHCHVTLRREDSVRIPCRNCQTVSFCSEKCRFEAWRNYHELECRVFSYFFEVESNQQHRQTSHLLLAYRTTIFKLLSAARNDTAATRSAFEEILALDLFKNNCPETQIVKETKEDNFEEEFVEKIRINVVSATDGKESEKISETKTKQHPIDAEEEEKKKHTDLGSKKVYDSLDYRTVLQLETHCRDAEPCVILLRTIEAVFLAKCLLFSLGISSLSSSDALASLSVDMLRHLLAINCNAYEIIENVRDEKTRVWEPRNVGGAIYTTVSLVNHGCYPNVVRHSYPRGLVVVRTTRLVKKGSELLDCYGPHFISENKLARREYLWRKYRFVCSCDACTNNWQLPLQESVGYKCPLCSEIINFIQKTNDNVTKVTTTCCTKCKKKTDLKKLEKQLHKSMEKRKKATSKMFNGNYKEALTLLLEHGSVVEQYLPSPNMEAIKTQQCIIQCYNSFGCTSK